MDKRPWLSGVKFNVCTGSEKVKWLLQTLFGL